MKMWFLIFFSWPSAILNLGFIGFVIQTTLLFHTLQMSFSCDHKMIKTELSTMYIEVLDVWF